MNRFARGVQSTVKGAVYRALIVEALRRVSPRPVAVRAIEAAFGMSKRNVLRHLDALASAGVKRDSRHGGHASSAVAWID